MSAQHRETETSNQGDGQGNRPEQKASRPVEESSPSNQNALDVSQRGTVEGVDPAAELQAKVAALEDSLLRARADFQNLQKRTRVEKSEAIRFANAELIKSLLCVVDDLERTLAAAAAESDIKVLRQGVRLAYENFTKVLRAEGVEPIAAVNQAFDPAQHNALMQRETSDVPPGTVVEEVTRGYRLHERILRPAMVIVAKPEADAEVESTAE